MEELEQAKAVHAQAARDKEAADSRIRAVQQDLETREKNCREQIEMIRAERQAHISAIPVDLFRLYERLTARKLPEDEFHLGVAPVENDSCGSCHLRIPPDLKLKVRTNHDTTCGNCGVILYINE